MRDAKASPRKGGVRPEFAGRAAANDCLVRTRSRRVQTWSLRPWLDQLLIADSSNGHFLHSIRGQKPLEPVDVIKPVLNIGIANQGLE